MANCDRPRHEITRRALDHMVDVITSTRAELEPFPHFIAEIILPPDIYDDMLAQLPDPSLYEPLSYEHHSVNGVSNRGRFKLTNDSTMRLPPRQQSLWLGVRDALGAPELKAAVFGQLRRGLAFRFRVPQAAVGQLPGYPLPELFRETAGYSIKPHPDTRKKVVTMQIALPTDDAQSGLGTEFYRRSLNPLHLLREPRGFEVAKLTPFVPNAAYAFAVINSITLKSWHGRTRLAEAAGVRNSILNIWYIDAAQANPDVVEQYYKAAA